MGFFNLQVTVSRSASTADICTTTRPSFVFPSVFTISTGFGGQPKTIQRLLPWLDAKGPCRRQKKGAISPLSSGLGLLIR